MRRILLGSTALAAIAVLGAPGVASAEEGLKLTLGGRYLAAFGGLIGEDENLMPTDPNGQLRDYVVKQDVEIHFKGETTFDNGLTVGVRVELEGQTSAADQIDAVYAYFDTKWGELRFGDTLESLASLCYTVPSASNIFGADSPIFNFSNAGVLGYAGTNGTCYGIDSKSTKVVYFSPTFGGFNFAVSFTPDDTEDTRNTTNGAGNRFSNNFGQNSENISVGATYEREFNGFGFVLAAADPSRWTGSIRTSSPYIPTIARIKRLRPVPLRRLYAGWSLFLPRRHRRRLRSRRRSRCRGLRRRGYLCLEPICGWDGMDPRKIRKWRHRWIRPVRRLCADGQLRLGSGHHHRWPGRIFRL